MASGIGPWQNSAQSNGRAAHLLKRPGLPKPSVVGHHPVEKCTSHCSAVLARAMIATYANSNPCHQLFLNCFCVLNSFLELHVNFNLVRSHIDVNSELTNINSELIFRTQKNATLGFVLPFTECVYNN